jgi:hypothetical protein
VYRGSPYVAVIDLSQGSGIYIFSDYRRFCYPMEVNFASLTSHFRSSFTREYARIQPADYSWGYLNDYAVIMYDNETVQWRNNSIPDLITKFMRKYDNAFVLFDGDMYHYDEKTRKFSWIKVRTELEQFKFQSNIIIRKYHEPLDKRKVLWII